MSKPANHTVKPKENRQSDASEHQGTDLRRRLLQCMAEILTQRQYQVFVLSCLEGMSQQEIAYELEISPSTVCRAAMQSRYKMRKAMGYEIEKDNYLEKDMKIFPNEPYAVQLPGIKCISTLHS